MKKRWPSTLKSEAVCPKALACIYTLYPSLRIWLAD